MTVIIAAICAAAAATITAIAQWRMHRAQGRKVEVDAQGEIIEDLRSHIAYLRSEFAPNGGLSMRDSIDRAENVLAKIEYLVRNHADDHDERLTVILRNELEGVCRADSEEIS